MTVRSQRDHAPTLSVVILTLDEEANIERCLASVAFADQVVVVDSGSGDTTEQRAKAGGAEVVVNRQPAPFDIAEQRNWALDHGGLVGDWVLFLDADEALTSALRAELSAVMADPGALDAYELTPKYLFRGQWMRRSMNYPNYHARLLRRGRARFTGGVWEHFTGVEVIGRISEPYLHFGNSKGTSDWIRRHDRYSDWEAAGVARYLATGDPAAFRTGRQVRLRRFASHTLHLRPGLRFLVMYVLRGGFLDGRHAWTFCQRYALYEFMIAEKVRDLQRRAKGQDW